MNGAFLIDHGDHYVSDSVQSLIEGIYAERPANARRILRSRIYVAHEPTLAEKELIRVAAKRWTITELAPIPESIRVSAPPLDPPPELPRGLGYGSQLASLTQAHEILDFLLAQTNHAAHRFASDRPVAALLLDSDQRLLAAELNTNARVKTRHAEMNLLLRYGRLPKNATLIVTLKPCAMCAAKIWEAAEDLKSLRVYYLEDDPGKFGRNTILTKDSPARLRFLGREHPLYAESIQFPISRP